MSGRASWHSIVKSNIHNCSIYKPSNSSQTSTQESAILSSLLIFVLSSFQGAIVSPKFNALVSPLRNWSHSALSFPPKSSHRHRERLEGCYLVLVPRPPPSLLPVNRCHSQTLTFDLQLSTSCAHFTKPSFSVKTWNDCHHYVWGVKSQKEGTVARS
ncbi:hypothetical protein K439DRAFT_1616119 [Ramaria rubella]|nr:hypothetical protein K439DRAFT_1616119 [Ramaria rubella]